MCSLVPGVPHVLSIKVCSIYSDKSGTVSSFLIIMNSPVCSKYRSLGCLTFPFKMRWMGAFIRELASDYNHNLVAP